MAGFGLRLVLNEELHGFGLWPFDKVLLLGSSEMTDVDRKMKQMLTGSRDRLCDRKIKKDNREIFKGDFKCFSLLSVALYDKTICSYDRLSVLLQFVHAARISADRKKNLYRNYCDICGLIISPSSRQSIRHINGSNVSPWG